MEYRGKVIRKRRFALALALVAFALGAAGTASAVPRNCPRGKIWDPNRGSCVKKRRASRSSPEKKYQLAVAHLEGTARRADPSRAPALLERACEAEHAPSCTLLAFLHLRGREVREDAQKSLELYARACEHGDPFGCLGAAEVHGRELFPSARQADGIPFLRRACALGSGRGCYELGDAYRQALGVERDLKKAEESFARAFERLSGDCPGDPASCHLLGLAYRYGLGTEPKPARALRAFERGCRRGSGDACHQLGVAHQLGVGTRADPTRALQIYERACRKYDSAAACHDAGSLMAGWSEDARDTDRLAELARRACDLDRKHCEVLAHLHHKGIGVPPDPAKSTRWYLTACEHGNAAACFSAGVRALRGLGMPRDAPKAIELWRRSCTLDYPEACERLASQYAGGEHVRKDEDRALELHHLACVRGHARSCHLAAELLEGRIAKSGEPELERAARFYEEACNLERGQDCVELGELYLIGHGVGRDGARARELFRRACDLGWAEGCSRLGFVYFRGEGVEKDELAAGLAFEEACRKGAGAPCRWLELLLERGGASDEQKAHAVKTLEGACEDRHETACSVLAGLLAGGGSLVGEADGRRAFGIYEESCARGSSESCVGLARCYSEGIGVVTDDERAKALLKEQCNANAPGACSYLGIKLWEDAQYREAALLFRRACDEGDGTACSMLGFAHYTARGVRWNLEAARKAWKLGCDQKVPSACANLGELYERGIGVEADPEQALEYHLMGCTPSTAAGCAGVGRIYAAGEIVEADPKRAAREFARACEKEAAYSPEACRALALLYRETGEGSLSAIASLEQRALDVARSVAEDNPYGHYLLGLFYLDGVALVRDPEKALSHFRTACEGYEPLACERAGELLARGAGGDRPKLEAAAVSFGRACAAGLADACEAAEDARRRIAAGKNGKKKPPPLAPAPRRGGCACDAAPGPAGPLALFLALLAFARPGRRSRR